jgi:hypothetical protein
MARKKPGPPKGSGGRPRKVITKEQIEQIEKMAGLGLTEEKICLLLGISERTLLRRKKDHTELLSAMKRGMASAEGTVGTSLYDKAVAGDLGAIVWWEKTRSGRTDRQAMELTGRDGQPLEVSITRRIVNGDKD